MVTSNKKEYQSRIEPNMSGRLTDLAARGICDFFLCGVNGYILNYVFGYYGQDLLKTLSEACDMPADTPLATLIAKCDQLCGGTLLKHVHFVKRYPYGILMIAARIYPPEPGPACAKVYKMWNGNLPGFTWLAKKTNRHPDWLRLCPDGKIESYAKESQHLQIYSNIG